MLHRRSPEIKFYSKVLPPNENGCMQWTGCIDGSGYGYMEINKKMIKVHRYSYQLWHGKKIPKNMCICHSCDNITCVNPKHLWIGTRSENNKDRAKKKRSFKPRGELSAVSKLTNLQVIAIKKRLRKPSIELVKLIADEYKVSYSAIDKIKAGINWKFIK